MGFKANWTFLGYLTMGAAGVRATLGTLRDEGFEPIELERYCTTNKLWATKVKRLRLPDILCIRTGIRVEVRAKSALKVRMSDAPSKPERRWDVGLRDEDLVAFVPCMAEDEKVKILGRPVFFSVADLRASMDATKLGRPKAASEGAERDREWPSTVPSGSGEILEVGPDKIVARLVSGRKQTYRIQGRPSYVRAGDTFAGGVSILAGVVPRLALVGELRSRSWEAQSALSALEPVDRYAAARAIPHLRSAEEWGIRALERAISGETDERVALEMAASAARLGAAFGMERISAAVWSHPRVDLRMEGLLILSELGTTLAAEELLRVASSDEFAGSELRQAAVWGLGRAGVGAFGRLVDFIADRDEGVALHAIAAYGPGTPTEAIEDLVARLVSGTPRARAAASAALQTIGSAAALEAVVRAVKQYPKAAPWLLATLGKFPADWVRSALAENDSLLSSVEPLLVLESAENWLARPAVATDLRFLLSQNMFP